MSDALASLCRNISAIKEASFSRPAASFATARSCTSRHKPQPLPVFAFRTGIRRSFQPAGRMAHPVRVIAKRLMKRRAFADGTVNQVGIVGIAEGEHVRFDGNQQISGCVRELAQHGLAADDHDFGRPGDAGGGRE